jgi:UDP-N-acetylglucosamine 1-carboxyvinyltransferase
MNRLIIRGGRTLRGTVDISGAKNAALPLMAAALLSEEPLVLGNVPHLADIASMMNLLGQLGVSLEMDGHTGQQGQVLRLHAQEITSIEAPYDIVRTMRASVLVLGPLLARVGKARVSLPGGCAIGTRPIDLHLHALALMGAEITLEEGYVLASVPAGRLKGAEIHFDKVSVGATENALMAASLADGTTVLHNAAKEPEITDLAKCLQAMGAEIEGLDTDRLVIHGVKRLHTAHHQVVADRIEMGTYAIAAAMTGGDVLLRGAQASLLGSFGDKLQECGVVMQNLPEGIRVKAAQKLIALDVDTQPFPGFATDMQAQFMALMCVAEGASLITESIFENRFMHVPELVRMGANISLRGSTAVVRGGEPLKGASVMATDLRASVSLVLAALAAEGETVLHRIYHLDRGYERVEEKLSRLGAMIERVG